MKYIYHLKPDPFEGTTLIPLNLMDKSSDLYKKHSAKYIGREALMLETIPKLNCKWNDVVQFSALDPQILVKKLKEIYPEMKPFRAEYFKISIEQLLPKHQIAIFNRNPSQEKGNFKVFPEDIELLTADNYKEIKEVPLLTIQYWEDVKRKSGKPLWFPFIPHIFVKGIVETSDFEVCTLDL